MEANYVVPPHIAPRSLHRIWTVSLIEGGSNGPEYRVLSLITNGQQVHSLTYHRRYSDPPYTAPSSDASKKADDGVDA